MFAEVERTHAKGEDFRAVYRLIGPDGKITGVMADEKTSTDFVEIGAFRLLNDISSNIHTSGTQYTSTDEDQTSTLSSAMNL